MGKLKVVLLAMLILGVACTMPFVSGDTERGKELFTDQKLGGSTNEKSCASCHPGGKGLEKSCDKKSFMEGKVHSLSEMANMCTKSPNALEGVGLSKQDSKDIVAYICSLKGAE